MAEKESDYFKYNDTVFQRNYDRESKLLEQALKQFQKNQKAKVEAVKSAEKALADAKKFGTKQEVAAAKEALKAKEKQLEKAKAADKNYQYVKQNYQKIAQQQEIDSYRRLSLEKKKEYVQQTKDRIKQSKEENNSLITLLKEQLKEETDEKKKVALNARLTQAENNKKILADDLKTNEERLKSLNKIKIQNLSDFRNLDKNLKQKAVENGTTAVNDKNTAKEKISSAKSTMKNLVSEDKNVIKAQKELDKLKKSGTKHEIEGAKKRLEAAKQAVKNSDEYKEALEQINEAQKEVAESNKEIVKSAMVEAGADALSGVKKAGAKIVDDVKNSITTNVDAMFGMQGRMMGRLQGSAIDWAESVEDVSELIGFSGAVSKKNVVSKMVELVDSGVAYNLEMRAFLSETSENIASTFEAANGTLLRLIRIQQQDTTAARLGMEAKLTSLFNEFFSDTSYLANNVSQSVSDAILDAAATMSRNDSLQFEYVLQKWLGSLYSIGLSDSAVATIASGINYLGTGNVSALSSNDSLQTLLALSASRTSGKSYAELLTGGLTAKDTNDLLKSMIEYLAEIAESQENYVTKAAYADIFGMSMTDLSIFSSLKQDEISRLYEDSTSYKALVTETQNQLNTIYDRLHLSKIVDTAIDNAMVGAASTIGGSAGLYGTWKALTILEDLVGEIKIPSVLAAGFGIGDLDLLNVAQTIMVGIGMIGSLLEGVSSADEGGALNLNRWLYRWGFSDYTPRGNTLPLLKSGAKSGTSLSAMLGAVNASSEDIETTTLETGEQIGSDELNKIQSEELSEEEHDINHKIWAAIADEDGNTVLKVLMGMCKMNEEDSEGPSSSDSTTTGSTSTLGGSNPDKSSGQSSTDIYNKIYEAIADGESVNVLSVLQEINEKLELSRVFYTSMSPTSSSNGIVGSITNMYPNLHAPNMTPSRVPFDDDYFIPPHSLVGHKNKDQPLKGQFMSKEEYSEDLQLIISTAVETALRSVAGYSSGTGLPVVVTNLNTYGG